MIVTKIALGFQGLYTRSTSLRHTLAAYGKASLQVNIIQIVFGVSLETGMTTGEQFVKRFFKKLTLENLINDEIFLNERVDVIATFGISLNPCTPVRFRRANGREVEITEIGLRHPTTRGTRTIHMFDVTDGGADYRLELDSERLTWHLTREGDRDA